MAVLIGLIVLIGIVMFVVGVILLIVRAARPKQAVWNPATQRWEWR